MIDRSDEYDDFRDELIAREWETDGVPPECAVCGAPIQWAGSRFLHVAPSAPREMRGEPGTIDYTVGQVAWGWDLGDWILRTSGHAAALADRPRCRRCKTDLRGDGGPCNCSAHEGLCASCVWSTMP